MIFRYFYDNTLAQASYLVGCAATGEALIVDPMRDIQPYLAMAEKEGLRITHVTETHIHADFVSGIRDVAAATGATMYLSDMGDADWKYGFANDPQVILVRDGDAFMVGNIRIEVLATPGHTLEHVAFGLTDTAAADKPMGVFTGDFLFVGDVGRPDLLEEAAGFVGTKEPGARTQYQTVERFKQLPDYLQIWPAHGAGSACGKALGAIPSTTLGYEKLFNPAFQFNDEESFVKWLLADQPEPPRYFAQMKHVNKVGSPLVRDLVVPQQLDRDALDAALADGLLVVDMRSREDYVEAHIAGTLSVPMGNTMFSTYVGWFVDYKQPMYFITPDAEAVELILIALRAIGIDNVPGYFLPEVVNGDTVNLPTFTAQELAERMQANGLMVLDVRGGTEFAQGHIPSATNIPLGYLPRHLDQLPTDRLIVTNCASGYRSQVAASLLRKLGFTDVANLNEGESVWADVFAAEVAR
ncbi:MAG: MBL fold metallo-hydrolase [Chloroflexaceae bacterium]|nr:MBL fold metallo-hydrolase [Chloroflexaceae bacterium]